MELKACPRALRHSPCRLAADRARPHPRLLPEEELHRAERDRKSTRLNSSHVRISYAVFCLKKKKKQMLECHFDICHALISSKDINLVLSIASDDREDEPIVGSCLSHASPITMRA